MHCFRCHAENAEGSKFCGHCGAPMGGPSGAHEIGDVPTPRVTGSTTQLPAGPVVPSQLPPLTREGVPVLDDSLGGSLRVPVSRGARVAMIAIVLALDLAMAAAGVWLLTRSKGGGEPASADGGTIVAVTDGGVVVEVVPDAAVASGGGGARGTGAVPVGGGGGSVGGGGRGTGGGGRGTGGDGAGSVGGGGRGTGTSGGGTGGGGTGGGTGTSVTPIPIDAAPPSSGAPDAAPTPATTPDAAAPPSPPPDAAPAPDDPSADSLPDQVAVKLHSSQSRLSRCYTQATKGLPEDEPLSGEVDIAFEVMPTGETKNVSVARNTTGSNQLGSCISDIVAGWAFEPFTGESVTLQRTFRFRGQG